MTLSIEYITNLSANNNNIVIFVSNISQLKNIDFLPNLDIFLKDKKFIKQINNNSYNLIRNFPSKNDKLINILIFIVKTSSKKHIELGSSVYDHVKTLIDKNATFFFSKTLSTKYKIIVSDLIFGFSLKNYNFDKYISSKNKDDKIILNLINLKPFKELEYKINLLKSINYTKDLVSEPANILNPITYSDKCVELKKIGLTVKILNQNKIKKIGMKSLLSVSDGSEHEARVVIFEWNIKKNKKPTILVGKGVTFDTGGISLKQSGGMEEMITDMGGSAVVVGSMINAALNKSKHSLVGVIGLVENMPDGKSQRPGDIIKSLSGKTIEVLNTDAEGRLVLADILTYIQNQYFAKQIIDFATLTGAIMIALGTHRAGLFSNNDSLSAKLINSGEITKEKLWRLPLGEEYNVEINSSRADMKNIGSSRYGGSIHAAEFIQRFIRNKTPWAHLDIAGVSWTMKGGKNSSSNLHTPGATAFGVRLIDQFLKGK